MRRILVLGLRGMANWIEATMPDRPRLWCSRCQSHDVLACQDCFRGMGDMSIRIWCCRCATINDWSYA